jgi:hypothetical protein
MLLSKLRRVVTLWFCLGLIFCAGFWLGFTDEAGMANREPGALPNCHSLAKSIAEHTWWDRFLVCCMLMVAWPFVIGIACGRLARVGMI